LDTQEIPKKSPRNPVGFGATAHWDSHRNYKATKEAMAYTAADRLQSIT